TVSSALPAHGHCPTVVVPLRGGEGETAVVTPARRIVVGVDGSPWAHGALQTAIDQARLWDAELVAVAGVPVGSGSGLLAWLPAAIDHEQVLADIAVGVNRIVDEAEAANPGMSIRRIVLDGTGAELLSEFS